MENDDAEGFRGVAIGKPGPSPAQGGPPAPPLTTACRRRRLRVGAHQRERVGQGRREGDEVAEHWQHDKPEEPLLGARPGSRAGRGHHGDRKTQAPLLLRLGAEFLAQARGDALRHGGRAAREEGGGEEAARQQRSGLGRIRGGREKTFVPAAAHKSGLQRSAQCSRKTTSSWALSGEQCAKASAAARSATRASSSLCSATASDGKGNR